MYLILSGTFPFDGDKIEHDICRKQLIFTPVNTWSHITVEAKDLIKKLLRK